MTPEERQRLEDLEKKVQTMYRVEDIVFIEAVTRRIFNNIDVSDLPKIKLSDLSDVQNTDTATTGQVLKKTATTWQPGTDDT